MTSVYHEGELEVQARAGVREMASRIGRGIHPSIPEAAREFMRQQPFVIVGSVGDGGRVWASVLTGEPGFITATDERTVRIKATPTVGDPLRENLLGDGAVGLLLIEFATRRRMRLNGRAEMLEDGQLLVRSEQVYSNCPKYIQARDWTWSSEKRQSEERAVLVGKALTGEQQRWIREADTFFIASFHREGGADASHRGGNPGFVKVADERHLVWPDYAGNNMFQTLGNIRANPHAGLLFIDFERGRTLQLTGTARVSWDARHTSQFAGAERVVQFEVEQVIEIANATRMRWNFLNYSPFNPEALDSAR